MILMQPKIYNRANTKDLEEIFEKYASFEKNGQKFITHQDFMTKFLQIFPNKNYNSHSLHLLAGIVNASNKNKKDELISFEEFQEFEGLLCIPDALYLTAFKLFDEKGTGKITYDEFINVMKKTELNNHIEFNKESKLLSLYFGNKKEKSIDYFEFRQLLHDYRKENIAEAFKKFDKDGKGYISLNDFNFLMMNLNKHLLTTDIELRFMQLLGEKGSKSVSFPYFVAFDSLLNNMETIMRIYLQITNGRKNVEITKDEFMSSALLFSPITPLQVDILYEICDEQQTGKITFEDLNEIAPNVCMSDVTENIMEIYYCSGSEHHRSLRAEVLEFIYRLIVGSIAGGCGIFVVYPIDLIKTRMQAQRDHARIYKNGLDCFIKVIKNEGFLGLYSGLLPQVVGNASAQAIKLVLNDFVKDKLMEEDGSVTLLSEIIAGSLSGIGLVLALNPVEVIKIRMQVAGETVGQESKSVFSIIRQLGLRGLYKGCIACILRDSPFCAIYFPVYTETKRVLADENGYNTKWELVVAGAIAGIPSALLVTPADVVKTRLQVAERAGRTTYTGIIDACRKIFKEEGHMAFWKGSAARVLRIAPSMAITLGVYEIIQRYFYIDFGGTHPSGSQIKPKKTNYNMPIKRNPDHIGGYKAANAVFAGLETRFGIVLPKFKVSTPVKSGEK